MTTLTGVKEDNKVFVGNLSFSTDDDALNKYFEPAGKVIDATVIKRGKHRSAGYGFVTFETDKEAEQAVDKFNKTELDDREITVQIARPKAVHSPTPKKVTTATTEKVEQEEEVEEEEEEEGKSRRGRRSRRRSLPVRRRSLPVRRPTTASTTRVFVANLPFSTTDDELAALFKDFTIEAVNVARLRNGRSKGYGFVDVADETQQQKIIDNFKPLMVEEREVSVKVAMVPLDVDAAIDQVKQDEEQ